MSNRNQLGLTSLSLLGTTILGVIITLSYANLSHFLAAENALEQTVKITSRCLSPSDPECVKLAPIISGNPMRYFLSTETPASETFSQLFDYSATLYEEELGADLPYYRLQEEFEPTFTYSTSKLKIGIFEAIEPRVRLALQTKYHGNIIRNYTTKAQPFFPKWNQEFEKQHENIPFSEQNRSERFHRVLQRSFSVTVSSDTDEYRTFSGLADINQLISPEPSLDCVPGEFCSGTVEAAGRAESDPNYFKRNRFLALYVEISPTSSSRDLELGVQAADGSDGFRVDVPSSNRRYLLGGRALSPVAGLRSFNLWLRGPVGSNGGEIGKFHSGIEVPIQGGSFRPSVHLRIKGKKGDSISGTVRVYGTTDAYTKRSISESASYTCSEVTIPNGAALSPLIPAAGKCGADASFVQSEVETAIVSENLGCVPEDQNNWALTNPLTARLPTAQIAQTALTTQTTQRILCSGAEEPNNKVGCGWRRKTERELTIIGSQLPGCPQTTVSEPTSIRCSETSTPLATCLAATKNDASCPNITLLKERFAQTIAELRQEGVDTTSLSEPVFSKLSGARVADRLSCLPLDSSGNDASNCAIRSLKHLTSKKLSSKRDGSLAVSASELIDSGSEPFCNQETPLNVRRVSGPTPVSIIGYPFTEDRELEISPVIPSPEKLLCLPDSPAVEMESVLRDYAVRAGYEAAADRSVRFDFEIKNLNQRILVSTTDGCDSRNLVPTNSCQKLSSSLVYGSSCKRELDLGLATSPPQICLNNASCFGIPESPVIQVDPVPAEEGVSRAKSLGAELLARYLPGQDARLEVSLDNDTVTVRAHYEMPLSFPLDAILRRPTISLSRATTEQLEAR